MNEARPSTPPQSPPPGPAPAPTRDSAGWIALRAVLGFATFALSAGLPLALRRESIAFPILVVLVAIVLAIQRKWRGFALGVFLGVGVVLLLVGLCIATFKI